jgi:hypothetical protein
METTTISILSRWSGRTLYTHTAEGASMREAVLAALAGDANLGGADLGGADLRDADLRDADLRGADLCGADLGDADLRDADLRDADLRGADLRGANLRDADLRGANLGGANLGGADLRGANLGGANLGGADLGGANLGGANLGGADLGGSLRSLLALPDLDKQMLAVIEAEPESLDMSSWHSTSCGTTHCRAGWATVLVGPAAQALEAVWGTAAVGALIYAASYPELPIPSFYTDNETALADIRQRAALAAS